MAALLRICAVLLFSGASLACAQLGQPTQPLAWPPGQPLEPNPPFHPEDGLIRLNVNVTDALNLEPLQVKAAEDAIEPPPN